MLRIGKCELGRDLRPRIKTSFPSSPEKQSVALLKSAGCVAIGCSDCGPGQAYAADGPQGRRRQCCTAPESHGVQRLCIYPARICRSLSLCVDSAGLYRGRLGATHIYIHVCVPRTPCRATYKHRPPIMAASSHFEDPSAGVELIFLGTGCSASLPQIACLTAPPDQKPCRTCLSSLHPEGKKNIRRNTSAVFRVKDKHGKKMCVAVAHLPPISQSIPRLAAPSSATWARISRPQPWNGSQSMDCATSMLSSSHTRMLMVSAELLSGETQY